MNWRMVDKQLGCCIFCRGVVGFVFKFCSNWTNFDFFYSIFNAQGWSSVRARKVSEMVSGPTSLSLTLSIESKRFRVRSQIRIQWSCPPWHGQISHSPNGCMLLCLSISFLSFYSMRTSTRDVAHFTTVVTGNGRLEADALWFERLVGNVSRFVS